MWLPQKCHSPSRNNTFMGIDDRALASAGVMVIVGLSRNVDQGLEYLCEYLGVQPSRIKKLNWGDSAC